MLKGESDLATRLSNMIRETTGQALMSPARRRRFNQFSRQAVSLAKLGDFESAEATMLTALEIYPEIADLHGTLGWIYKTWIPTARYTDARERFARAAELKAKRDDTYWHWSHMEQKQSEWTAAAQAAEKGIEFVRFPERLHYMAGFSQSRLAQDLYQQAQYGRAKQEAAAAESHLDAALVNMKDLENGQYEFHSRVYRAKAINHEYLVLISQAQRDAGSERRYLRLLSRTMEAWRSEHPYDRNANSECQRITYRLGNLEPTVSV